MDEKSLKQKLLNGKKTERVIFAVTPEMKEALAAVAKDRCMSVSGLLTALAVEEINRSKDVVSAALIDVEVK